MKTNHTCANLKRRDALGLLLGMNAVARAALDKRDAMESFQWARIKFRTTDRVKDRWDIHPGGDTFLLKMLKESTGLNVDPTWYAAPLDDLEELCKFPLLFMTTEGRFQFTERQQNNLVEYLKRGGFVFADDCVNKQGQLDGFFRDFKTKCEKLFNQPMVKLPNSHPIYHSFYDFPRGLPYMQGINHGGHALFLEERMAVFLSPSDIHCGWKSAELIHNNNPGWFSRYHSSNAIKMGINIMMYVMTH